MLDRVKLYVCYGILILILGCTVSYNAGYNARHGSTYIYVKSDATNINLRKAMDANNVQCSDEQFQGIAKYLKGVKQWNH